jgi:chemotaxis protein CheX
MTVSEIVSLEALPPPDIVRVVADVFRTMLQTEVVAAEGEPLGEREVMTAAVSFAGDWRGAVLLECASHAAFRFTSGLMSVAEPASLDADVRDTLGELTNMIAGNLKALLPSGSAQSMPSVVAGRDDSVSVCRGTSVVRIAFQSEHGPFAVTVIEAAPRPEPAH